MASLASSMLRPVLVCSPLPTLPMNSRNRSLAGERGALLLPEPGCGSDCDTPQEHHCSHCGPDLNQLDLNQICLLTAAESARCSGLAMVARKSAQ